MLQNAEYRLLNIVHDHIQIDFIFFIALCIKSMPQLDHIRVAQLLHDLQLSILISFVLVNFLYCNLLICLINNCLEHNTKRSIPDNTFSIVRITRRLLIFLLHLFFEI